MLEILAIGFAIFIVLKLFEGPVVKLLPSLLLASVLHAPKLITYVPEAMDANRTGNHYIFVLSIWNIIYILPNIGSNRWITMDLWDLCWFIEIG